MASFGCSVSQNLMRRMKRPASSIKADFLLIKPPPAPLIWHRVTRLGRVIYKQGPMKLSEIRLHLGNSWRRLPPDTPRKNLGNRLLSPCQSRIHVFPRSDAFDSQGCLGYADVQRGIFKHKYAPRWNVSVLEQMRTRKYRWATPYAK